MNYFLRHKNDIKISHTRLTTLPALAATSKSEERIDSVAFTDARSDPLRSARSRRHSMAKAFMIASVINNDLGLKGSAR